MRDPFEYDEDIPEDDDFDEDDEVRRAILEAETNEVWLEEPGDEDEEPSLPVSNPLFGLFSASGGLNIPGVPAENKQNKKADDEKKEKFGGMASAMGLPIK